MRLCKTQAEQVHTVLLDHEHQESEFRLEEIWRGTAIATELHICKEE